MVWASVVIQPTITGDEVPNAYKLGQNFPNPFNPTTTIKFDVRAKGHVKLQIYNVAGQLIKTMVDEVMDAGSYSKEWTGVNNAGAKVASGVYFYRFEAENFTATKKMVLLR
jgi:flagellar hook assembly protein FlgD